MASENSRRSRGGGIENRVRQQQQLRVAQRNHRGAARLLQAASRTRPPTRRARSSATVTLAPAGRARRAGRSPPDILRPAWNPTRTADRPPAGRNARHRPRAPPGSSRRHVLELGAALEAIDGPAQFLRRARLFFLQGHGRFSGRARAIPLTLTARERGFMSMYGGVFARQGERSLGQEDHRHGGRGARALGCAVESVDYRGSMIPARGSRSSSRVASRLPGPLVLVGSSMGGHVSAAAAAATAARAAFSCWRPPSTCRDSRPTRRRTSRCPTAIVHGWHDDIVPVENSIRWAREHQCALHVLNSDHRLGGSHRSDLRAAAGTFSPSSGEALQ